LLQDKIAAAAEILNNCTLCPRNCLVDRHHGERGLCRTGDQPVTSSYSPHFGEEDPLVGRRGSGTIFFAHCNLYCLFCQNYEISHGGEGEEVSFADLAAMMLNLQQRGCHNLNFVTPSHQVYQILEALRLAIEGGLKLPLVYNTGGYDALKTLRILDGVIDIYMPDFKFWDPAVSAELCGVEDYPEIARQALGEMHRQVGDLVVDDDGVARRGLLVRHLVLPDGLAGTGEIMEFLAREISPRTYVNVMGQYHPCGRAYGHASLGRHLTALEHAEAQRLAQEAGLTRLDRREKLFRWL
jgi:putative pyruvate formate lyase activating enzyme